MNIFTLLVREVFIFLYKFVVADQATIYVFFIGLYYTFISWLYGEAVKDKVLFVFI